MGIQTEVEVRDELLWYRDYRGRWCMVNPDILIKMVAARVQIQRVKSNG